MLDIFIYFFQRVEENHQKSKEGNDITTSCILCKDSGCSMKKLLMRIHSGCGETV